MARTKLIVLGTRLFAEEVADLASECEEYELVAFGENWERERCDRLLLGYPVIWVGELAEFAKTHLAICAIGTTRRSLFVEQVHAMGFQFATLRHPRAWVSRTSAVGPGSILGVGTAVGAHTVVGRHVIVNRGSLIGHHTTIGDYVTVAPGVSIAGAVRVGSGTYVGIGAVIVDRVTVGSNALIGAGAVVVKDVPDNVEVMGSPARTTRTGITGF
ncbi:MAG: acetyltransferase [bacterium]